MNKLFLLCAIVFAMLLTPEAYAQKHEILRLKDGTEITGIIERLPDGGIRITDINGDIFIFSADEISTIITNERKIKQLKRKEAKPPRTANNAKTKKSSAQKERSRSFGITIGYVSKQMSVDGDKAPWLILNNTEDGKEYSSAFQAGLEYSPVSKYGIGLQTGIFYEYCAAADRYNYTDYSVNVSSKEHNLSIPLRLLYSHEFFKNFRIFIYTGPSFDISLSYNSELYVLGAHETVNMFEEFDMNRFNLTWGIGGGISWKFLSLNMGCDWGILPIMQYDGSSFKLNKPFRISLGFIF